MTLFAARLSRLSLHAALLAASVLIGTAQIRADENDAVETEYLDYHRGIYAAVMCEGAGLEQKGVGDPNAQQLTAAHEKLAQAISASIGDEISAGRRLELIEQAKTEIRDLKKQKGCDDPEIKRVLDIYHTELEPALAQ
ncbi:MAG TPA: hypothetical protein VHA10_18910 [Hypericibacter adhaerens]|jgi:hypothetical protein|uniref:hypothetical protein n=1 Tax=Hypericibacter adhaerens TaxID=2602016 RepID=UPI002CEC4BEF|nr:hypothetical protein [Hypericibacter adhaerens]HWA45299.1 hypothetical protein [Hypericibacter adhaerens]